MKIKDVMSRGLIYCDVSDTLDAVSDKMRRFDIGFVLVCAKKKCVGVITDRDIALNFKHKIRDFMSNNMYSIDGNLDFSDALETMKKHKVKRLLVTIDGKISGVISLSDLVQYIDINSAVSEIFAIKRNDETFDVDVHDFIM